MSGNSKEERPGKSKVDTRGHPTSTKAWTAKSVSGQIFADRVSNEQISLSDGPEKDIGKYHAALTIVFDALSEEEVKECEDQAVEWNTRKGNSGRRRRFPEVCESSDQSSVYCVCCLY